MTAGLGKREEHKIATRSAIQSAADALFDSRGYADTTIKDIADAAGVTERTFFRYFSGKEALLVRDIEEFLPILGAEIRRRPAGEPPLDAVKNSFLALLDRLRQTRPNLSWLFHDGPPGPKLAKSTPGLLLKFEQEIVDALADRLHDRGPDPEFTAQVLARCAVAALRSAGIRYWQLRQRADSPGEIDLINQAFNIVRGAGQGAGDSA
ncbi:TetR/AcrR family transcriptional regulator [Mycolicibacterium sphagni]|uniref:TetR/AcrR family transcriptional regulator n=1 Tax=Mycolicibacterium sphagni TaxID=1786 RepID=A0ABX2K6S3_9MYCO|nr:TetR/AcrR family transcriptional regulator [Mycolicibacterium sphagni]NTY62788.1 TetR/AcrR family transcriptional regulator [Mycolicibacterium sphagni]